MKDKNNQEIKLGDTLASDYGYSVIVVEDEGNREWVGKLICPPGHPCENIPYHLNNGKGHTIQQPNN